MKVLHLSHHRGCLADFAEVGRLLGVEVESATFDDGYNIGPERAAAAWTRWGERLNAADAVLVSDTAPLARVVLDNMDDFRGQLIIWVCNRFDYADQASNDCGFPDPAYYELFRRARADPRVEIVSFTGFEPIYAREFGVELGSTVIKPLGIRSSTAIENPAPAPIERESTILVPPYINDDRLNLAGCCESAGVSAYCGRYGGAHDAATFKAIAHIPYSWSTFALFEHLQNAMAMFVPSLEFFRALRATHALFWPDVREAHLDVAEWFLPEHDFFVRFDSWKHLGQLLHETDLDAVRAATGQAAIRHTETTLSAWESVLARVSGHARASAPVGRSPVETNRSPAPPMDVELAVAARLAPFCAYLDAHTADACLADGDVPIPSRSQSFGFAFAHFARHGGRRVVELGTLRSFVHGGLAGCNSDDVSWWRPDAPENWDWGAGCFSLLAAICLGPLQPAIATVDLSATHLDRCRLMTAGFAHLFTYHHSDSVDYLRSLPRRSVDLLYLDTGDMWPIEPAAEQQLAEARAIVEADVLSRDGLLLIDDVRNATPERHGDTSRLGKSKYALPYLLEHGFALAFDGYQVALTPPRD